MNCVNETCHFPGSAGFQPALLASQEATRPPSILPVMAGHLTRPPMQRHGSAHLQSCKVIQPRRHAATRWPGQEPGHDEYYLAAAIPCRIAQRMTKFGDFIFPTCDTRDCHAFRVNQVLPGHAKHARHAPSHRKESTGIAAGTPNSRMARQVHDGTPKLKFGLVPENEEASQTIAQALALLLQLHEGFCLQETLSIAQGRSRPQATDTASQFAWLRHGEFTCSAPALKPVADFAPGNSFAGSIENLGTTRILCKYIGSPRTPPGFAQLFEVSRKRLGLSRKFRYEFSNADAQFIRH